MDFPIELAFMFPPGGEASNFQAHLGVAYIQAYLAKHGIASEQVISPIGSTINDCVEQLVSTKAKIIGFTCYDSNYRLVNIISSLIKRRRPETILIAGGPTATFSDELLLTNSEDIDLCVRFEGEQTTLELVSRIEDGGFPHNLQDIPGITYKYNNKITKNIDRELFGYNDNTGYSLDGLPSPYLEGILSGTEAAGILSSRGCTQHCIYCNFSAMSKHTIRYHSINRIIDELKYIQSKIKLSPSKYALYRHIDIQDDNFTINNKRAKEICRRIIDEGIKLSLSCNCRPENVDEELVELLSYAGFSHLYFGLESAVPRVIRNIRRICHSRSYEEDFSIEEEYLEKVKEGVNLAKRYNMDTSVSIILGLPGETLKDGLKTIEFVRKLGVDYYAHNYLGVFAGTELFNKSSNYGLKIKPSRSVLPYEVQYTYPVHEVPFGRNSSLQQDMDKVIKQVLKAFAGGPEPGFGSENSIYSALIEISPGDCLYDRFKWLSNCLAIGGKVFLLGKRNNSLEDLELMRQARLDSGLAGMCCFLRNLSNDNSEIIYEIVNRPFDGRLSQWDPHFHMIPIREFLNFVKDHGFNRSWPIYCLNNKADVYFLETMARLLAHQGDKIWLDGVFIDGCRWSCELCPAISLKRVIITQNGEVLPCITGLPLGVMTDSVQNIRNNAAKLHLEVRRDRECDKCPVNSRCSKCLFTYPLTPQEYCELQRRNLNISGIITRSKMVNTFTASFIESL